MTEFSRVLRAQPNNAKAYLKRGEVHLNLGNHKLAEADLRTVLKLDPHCEQAQQLLLDLPPDTKPAEEPPAAAATAATAEATPSVGPKSPARLPEAPKSATGLPVAPKSSSSLSRTTGPSTKAGYIAVNCPSCGKLGEVAWDRLSRVFSCAGCSKRFVVKSGGDAVEVISDNKGGWIEAKTVLEQTKRKWHRRRTVATFFFLLVILPVSLIGGYKVLQANTPTVVERELPKDLNARAELFGQAWMCGDIRLIQRLTSPAFTKKAFGWYTRHRPPTILRPTATSVPPEGIEGAKVEVTTRPGKSGMMVTIRVSNTKLAPDRPPTELTLAWEERDDHNWYFLP
ncbi:MAG: tetratricopeptide repeat protein [Gemmataceae bacterium]